jgi:hypothetical protein
VERPAVQSSPLPPDASTHLEAFTVVRSTYPRL